MKYIKLYEEYEDPYFMFHHGNYVIANSKYASNQLQKFFKNNIGKIIDSRGWGTEDDQYQVKYDSDDIEKFEYWFAVDEIINESNNKKDLIDILTQNKYNL